MNKELINFAAIEYGSSQHMACLCTWGSHLMYSGQVKCCEQNILSKFNVTFCGHLKERNEKHL